MSGRSVVSLLPGILFTVSYLPNGWGYGSIQPRSYQHRYGRGPFDSAVWCELLGRCSNTDELLGGILAPVELA